MIIKSEKFEDLLKSTMTGSWGRLDYENGNVNVRVVGMREFDTTKSRVYFNPKREQVVTGPRYVLMRSPFRLSIGRGYKLTSQLELVKPVPEGYVGMVIPNEMMTRVGLDIISAPMYEGFKGVIEVSVLPIGYVELTEMSSVGSLVFFELSDGVKKQAPKPANKKPAAPRTPTQTAKGVAKATKAKGKTGGEKRGTSSKKSTTAKKTNSKS